MVAKEGIGIGKGSILGVMVLVCWRRWYRETLGKGYNLYAGRDGIGNTMVIVVKGL